MAGALDPRIRNLAQAKNFAIVTTMLPSGLPMSHAMWIDADDHHVLINTETGRTKYKNVRRDPAMTVVIVDDGNFYRFAEVRGRVAEMITGDVARQHIDALSLKYTGGPYDGSTITTERVLLKLAPTRQLLVPEDYDEMMSSSSRRVQASDGEGWAEE